MRATSIQLYSFSRDDGGDAAYCGCYTVPCPDGDPRIADLERLNLGRAREQDGTVTRGFFFADEIDEMVARAERESGCFAETPWEYADLEVERLAADIDFVEHHGHLIRVEKLGAYPVTCPVCRGTGGGVYNDCPACDGNGVV